MDFPDTDDLSEGSWTSIDAVAFEEGKPASQTRFEQAILSPCAILVTNSDGSKDYILATDDAHGGMYRVSGDDVQPLHRAGARYSEDDLVSSAHTIVAGDNRLSTLYLYGGDADGVLLNQMTFHYRIWEKLASLPGIGFTLIFLGISLTVALELRITLKRLAIKHISDKGTVA